MVVRVGLVVDVVLWIIYYCGLPGCLGHRSSSHDPRSSQEGQEVDSSGKLEDGHGDVVPALNKVRFCTYYRQPRFSTRVAAVSSPWTVRRGSW